MQAQGPLFNSKELKGSWVSQHTWSNMLKQPVQTWLVQSARANEIQQVLVLLYAKCVRLAIVWMQHSVLMAGIAFKCCNALLHCIATDMPQQRPLVINVCKVADGSLTNAMDLTQHHLHWSTGNQQRHDYTNVNVKTRQITKIRRIQVQPC